ncbi:restriction endonuclease subunit S [Streptococcus suis]|nr:restriction endonuclease subunit S [Streptococcus suis]
MKTNNNIPAYRFQGYTDAWELRPLGEIGNTYTGLSGKTKDDFGHGDGRFVTYMNVFSNPISLPEMVEAVEIDESQNTVRYGDVLFTTSSETPEEVGMSSVWLENTENTYLNSFCFGFRPVKKVNPYYLAYLLRSSGMRRKISFLAQGISRYNISKTKMMELEISIPNENEQEAIGTFFSTLDRHITLHQRKLDTLKEQKKTYLKLLFPAKGQTKPALRLQGFEDDWEEVKLGKILKERNEQIAENEEYPLMSFVQGVGVTPKGERYDRSFLVKEDNKKYKKTELGDFIYSSNNLETGSIGFNKTGKAVISPVYSIFYSKDEFESSFIGILSQRKDFIAKMIKFRQGVVYGQWRIHENDFLQILLRIPTKAEMEKIIIFFQTLDQEIAQVEDKLASLKEMKKTLLRKLFV